MSVTLLWNYGGGNEECTHKTNRWEFTVWRGVWLLCLQWSEVSLSPDLALAFFFYDTLNSITFTFTILSLFQSGRLFSGLNYVTKTYKKNNKNKKVINLLKREQTTGRVACSFCCIHIPLASPTNWQVQLCGSYNEGKEVQVCISLRRSAWSFPFQKDSSLLSSPVFAHLLSSFFFPRKHQDRVSGLESSTNCISAP